MSCACMMRPRRAALPYSSRECDSAVMHLVCEAVDDDADERVSYAAYHEAGHVVGAAAFGLATEYATIGGGRPHVKPARGISFKDALIPHMIVSTAGDVALAVAIGEFWRPSWTAMRDYLAQARAALGRCDRCKEAAMLVYSFPHATDDALVEMWIRIFNMTTSLFCDDEIRGAMLTLARELRERTLMWRDDIDALMSRYSLRDAQERILDGSISRRGGPNESHRATQTDTRRGNSLCVLRQEGQLR